MEEGEKRQLSLGDSLTEENNTLSNSLNNSFEEELGHPFCDFEGRQLCSTPKKILRNIDLHVTCAANSQSLGVSLLEDDLLCTTELGTSLVSDEPGIIDSECVTLETSVDYKISDLGTSLVDAEPDVFDPDFICNVRATPKAIPALVSPEIDGSTKKSKLSSKALDMNNIRSVKTRPCSASCKHKCLVNLSLINIYHMRMRYWTKPLHMRTQFLLQTLDCSQNGLLMCDNGHRVCRLAFEKILRINKNKLTLLKRKQLSHGTVTSCGRSPKSTSRQVLEAINWIESFASVHGDRMPDSNKVMLPYRTEKYSLFRRYREESMDGVSRATFYRVWRDHFSHLKVKALNSFSKCTTCAFLEKQLEKTQLPHKRRRLRELRIEHNQRQMFERKYYYSKRSKSKASPSEFLSLIVDGMDQSKSNLPHFTGRRAKIINPTDLLKTHITGVIDHGHNYFQTYVDVGQFPHDPNLTINIILRALQKAAEINGNKLPPTLFIQADNCWRENKNKYVLSFCELLVREKIFHEVHLSFLMVGHTHEDVDAHFSHIAAALRKTDVETLDDLVTLLPNSKIIDYMFDAKQWLENYLNPLKKHTQPLHFKISRVDNNIKICYKGKVNQKWKILKESFFKKGGNKVCLPKGQPELLKEDHTKLDFVRLLNQMKNVASMFKKDTSMEWWERYIEKLKKIPGKRNKPQWILKTLPRQDETGVSERNDNVVPQQIMSLIDKETHEPEIIVRPVQMSRRGKGNTNSRQQTRQKRPNTKRKRRHISKERDTILVHCLLESDLKKHIWTILIWTLLQNLAGILIWLWLYRMISVELYFFLLAGDIALFLQVTFYLWMQILCIHVGAFLAVVNMELFHAHAIPVLV